MSFTSDYQSRRQFVNFVPLTMIFVADFGTILADLFWNGHVPPFYKAIGFHFTYSVQHEPDSARLKMLEKCDFKRHIHL